MIAHMAMLSHVYERTEADRSAGGRWHLVAGSCRLIMVEPYLNANQSGRIASVFALSGDPLQQIPRDDLLLDLGRSVRDEVGHHVPVPLLKRELGGISRVPVNPHRRLDGVLGIPVLRG